MRTPGLVLGATAALALAPREAVAAEPPTLIGEEEIGARRPPPPVSPDLLDPAGLSRFHLVTRLSFAEGGDTFADAGTLWTFEPSLMVRLAPGIAVGGALPLALDAQSRPDDAFLLGNVRLSAAGGLFVPLDADRAGVLDPRLHFAVGADVYLPTHTDPGPSGLGFSSRLCPSPCQARRLRAYEPALYLREAALARVRTQAAFSAAGLRIAGELGLTPGWYVQGAAEGEAIVLYGFGVRAEYVGLRAVAPFAELVGSGALQSPDRGGPPFSSAPDAPDPIHLSLGARVHVGEVAPALFVTLDLDEGSAFFGLDLAGVLRPSFRPPERDAMDRL